jgi:hypothetical protein
LRLKRKQLNWKALQFTSQILHNRHDMMRLPESREYAKKDLMEKLTISQEDIVLAPPTRIGVPRLVVHFRDAVDSRLTLLGSCGASTHARSAMFSATLPPWADRKGFFSLGGGDSPSNHISLHAFLIITWPRILEAVMNE